MHMYPVIKIFTGRNEVVAKVIFLHLFVILFTGGGVSASVHAGIPPPQEQTPPPDQPHPRDQTPPWEQTPPGSRHPPPPEQAPPRIRHPPGADTPLGSRLQHTVYERPVRILPECIIVLKVFSLEKKSKKSVATRQYRKVSKCMGLSHYF